MFCIREKVYNFYFKFSVRYSKGSIRINLECLFFKIILNKK